jgi:hypothetical protein
VFLLYLQRGKMSKQAKKERLVTTTNIRSADMEVVRAAARYEGISQRALLALIVDFWIQSQKEADPLLAAYLEKMTSGSQPIST